MKQDRRFPRQPGMYINMAKITAALAPVSEGVGLAVAFLQYARGLGVLQERHRVEFSRIGRELIACGQQLVDAAGDKPETS